MKLNGYCIVLIILMLLAIAIGAYGIYKQCKEMYIVDRRKQLNIKNKKL